MFLGIIDLMMEDIDRYGNSDFDFDVCEDGEFKTRTPPLKRRKKLKRTSREPVVKKPVL